ncbi:3391_t:CDS:10, partial [Gigaspora rosea]
LLENYQSNKDSKCYASKVYLTWVTCFYYYFFSLGSLPENSQNETFYENCQCDMDEYYQNDMDGRRYAFTVEFTHLGFEFLTENCRNEVNGENGMDEFFYENGQSDMDKFLFENYQSNMNGKRYAFRVYPVNGENSMDKFFYENGQSDMDEYYQNDMDDFLFENYQSNINEFPSKNCQNEGNDHQNGTGFLLFEKVIPESHSTFDLEQSASASSHNDYRGTDENVNNNLIEEQIIGKNYAFTHERKSESTNQINISDSFSSWDETEMKLNQHAKIIGFTLRRKRLELDKDGIIKRRSLNVAFPVHLPLIKVTSIARAHNHALISDVHLYASKYRKLSKNIIEKIEFYVTKENMGSKQIYPLLIAGRFSRSIYSQEGYLQRGSKVKAPLTKWHGDAQNLINKLLALKDQEPGWTIYTRIDLFDNRLIGLFWLSSTQHQCLIRYNDIAQVDNTFQHQQIVGSLLYRAKNIPKETINNIKTSLQFLLKEIESSDIMEVWELFDQDIQPNLQTETVGIMTQLQYDDNDEQLTFDLHIFNKLRVLNTFTYKVKKHVQRKTKYAYGFGKMKKALNLVLDLGCEKEFIDMVNGFIDCRKKLTNDANNENNNSHISDPYVQKLRGRPPNKRIKSASETNLGHVNSRHSAINPLDPNLHVQQHNLQISSSRTLFSVLNSNDLEENTCAPSDD